ncbi:MAG: class I SAM-dependent methyltransferase [Paracoccaceae bacterium]
MHLDVGTLRDFYYRNPLGRAAQRVVRDALAELWGDAAGLTVAGYGFAVPLLRPYLEGAARVTGLMPAPQGVMHWPAQMPNRSLLCAETRWPLAPASVDRLVMLHGLETSDHPRAVLAEAARVLAPEGQVVVIVPNRAGVWARSDATPFGYGRPYSTGQLEGQLREEGFAPEDAFSVLHQRPQLGRSFGRASPWIERMGQAAPWNVGGVLICPATLHRPAPTRPGLSVARRPLRVLEGLAPVPEAKPARG